MKVDHSGLTRNFSGGTFSAFSFWLAIRRSRGNGRTLSRSRVNYGVLIPAVCDVISSVAESETSRYTQPRLRSHFHPGAVVFSSSPRFFRDDGSWSAHIRWEFFRLKKPAVRGLNQGSVSFGRCDMCTGRNPIHAPLRDALMACYYVIELITV